MGESKTGNSLGLNKKQSGEIHTLTLVSIGKSTFLTFTVSKDSMQQQINSEKFGCSTWWCVIASPRCLKKRFLWHVEEYHPRCRKTVDGAHKEKIDLLLRKPQGWDVAAQLGTYDWTILCDQSLCLSHLPSRHLNSQVGYEAPFSFTTIFHSLSL